MLNVLRAHTTRLTSRTVLAGPGSRRSVSKLIGESSLGGLRPKLVSWTCRSVAVQETPTAGISHQTLEGQIGPLSTTPTVVSKGPLVIVVSGPSGVGKDAVLNSLRQDRPDLAFVVTATSREKRPGEVHGKDYLFVSKQQFEQWIAEDKMLEHAVVYGEYKGIPKSQVDAALANGSDVVLRIDVQGAAAVKRLIPDSVHIFLVAESESALVQRLVARKTETLDKLKVRVQTACSELQQIGKFDYVLVNQEGKLKQTVEQIAMLIDAEKLRVKRNHVPAAPEQHS